MKNIIILISFFFSLNASANETCIARKVMGTSWYLHYHVQCAEETFDTQKILTTLLFPLPYHWGNFARKYLYRQMSERGFQEVARLRFQNSPDPIHIFEKVETAATYCSVQKRNFSSSGIQTRKPTFDITVVCENAIPTEENFNNVTQEELDQYLQSRGYHMVIEANKGNLAIYRNK
ncbi:MAG: hypothetical protein EBS53_14155 [Bacteroidetes bacterium]|nr:hypothetical protein [Bacteroidota bacterium]